ncbi:hypothetical protein BC937DRAFT_88627 [Endogone sp. FLAS-F59071]|nr:hypothetical protein BC937DRAFT_88627 [Endogone sp. FLAS-F59071]|eukprot:RUS22519.1 hypothetical protein BC937DRAFT_88627 [Endogone sp. FLAS-F59071]
MDAKDGNQTQQVQVQESHKRNLEIEQTSGEGVGITMQPGTDSHPEVDQHPLKKLRARSRNEIFEDFKKQGEQIAQQEIMNGGRADFAKQSSMKDSDAHLFGGSRLSVGYSDFAELVRGGFSFIDKSMLIAEFIESSDKVSMIFRPCGFGKSINLSMLRVFFEKIENESDANRTIRENIFKQLRIYEHKKSLFNSEFGKYPVIFLDFKGITGDTWEEMLNRTHLWMAKIYREHGYVLGKLSQYEQTEFKLTEEKKQTVWYLKIALRELSEYLTRSCEKKCIVLAHGFDTLVEAAFSKGYYQVALDFFKEMFNSLLVRNTNLNKALFLGVLPLYIQNFFSNVPNVCIYTMRSPQYARYFGFTGEEVALIINQWRNNVSIESIQGWYNGHWIGQARQKYNMYNPSSITSLFSKKTLELKGYWSNIGP